MVEKGLGRESDEVIVGVTAEGRKRFIVQIIIKRKCTSQKSDGWEKQERNRGIPSISRGVLCINFIIIGGVTAWN